MADASAVIRKWERHRCALLFVHSISSLLARAARVPSVTSEVCGPTV